MIKEEITFPASNTLEENIVALAEHYNSNIKPGHGFFFDFSKTPEYEKPVLDYLKTFDWKLEYNNTFIRKPEQQNPAKRPGFFYIFTNE